MEPQATPIPPTPPIPTPQTPVPIQPPVQPPIQPIPVPEQPSKKIPKKLVIFSVVLLVIAIVSVVIKLFISNKTSPEPQTTSTEETQTTPSEPLDPMADWKTYTNNGLGISLMYPPEWPDPVETLVSTSTEVIFNDNLTIRIGVFYNQDLGRNYTFDEIAEISLPTDGTPAESFTITGREAKQIVYKTGEGLFETLIMIPSPISKDGIVTISYKIFPGDTTLQNKQIDQILSTFKFTTEENRTKIDCKNPRPEVCTLECIQNPPYVCGSDGKSYCTICQACANKDVAWYEMKASACEEQ